MIHCIPLLCSIKPVVNAMYLLIKRGKVQARFCEFVDHLRWPLFPDADLSRTWMSGKVPQYDVIVENLFKRGNVTMMCITCTKRSHSRFR